MDLDQLQSVRDRERQTDRLQQLRESFYEDAAAFVADLRAERNEAAAAAADPFDSPRVSRLSDRIRTAEQTLEAIYEKRVGKVVKAATFAAADLPAEADGMTKEEADLFETLVDEIEANRAQVLGRLSPDGDEGSADTDGESDLDFGAGDVAADADGGDGGVEAADVMGAAPADGAGDGPGPADAAGRAGPDADAPAQDSTSPSPPPRPTAEGGEREAEPPERSDDEPLEAGQESPSAGDSSDGENGDATPQRRQDVDRELVRITDDVGQILGVDEREYDLAADDVVTLPAENALPLLERGAAERVDRD